MKPYILISHEDFDAAALLARLTGGRTDIGATVSFIGYCRDENQTLQALELEHYPGMAEKQLAQIAGKAAARWPLQGIIIVHRTGRIEAGRQIVFVATASRHRQAAFDAASFLMDHLKSDVPFWKKEHPVQPVAGTSPIAGSIASIPGRSSWVEARNSDSDMKKRWDAE